MSDTLYEQAMSGITASEAFKAQLIAKMQEKTAQAADASPAEATESAKETQAATGIETKTKRSRTVLLRRLATVAACLVVGFVVLYAWRAMGLGGGYGSAAPEEMATTQDEAEMDVAMEAPAAAPEAAMEDGGLPALTVPKYAGEGMGFEGLMAYDVDELVSGNPWTADANLTHLPVYRNTAWREDYAQQGWPTDEEQGITETYIDPPLALPAGYSFTHYDTTYPQAQETLAWLSEKYAASLGITQPVQDISAGDYNIYGQQHYDLNIFESSGDITQQILNYHFNRAAFYCDDDGKLFLIRRWQTDLSGCIGDYPIITVDEARDLLTENHYITTVPEAMPGEKYIAKVELVYRTGTTEEVFMPYYRFLVEMPSMEQENGLKTFGAYYVPAVSEAYLTGLPLWDGSFN